MEHFDVAIIGAGVIGGLIARELTRYDLRVCLLERENDVAMGATRANSGIVHAGFDAEPGTLKARFNVAGSRMMKEVTDQLGVKYRNNGSLVIGYTEDDRARLNELVERGRVNGVEGIRLIEAEELRSLEPNISEAVTCALFAPTGGIVCPYELCIAAVGNAMDNGAVLHCGFEVIQIDMDEDTYVLTAENGAAISARYVVNAAGLYADTIAGLVGDRSFSAHPRRGSYILLDKECGRMVSHTIFRVPSKMGKGILVSPTVDGNLLLGPTSVDGTDREDRATHAEELETIMASVSETLRVRVPFGKSITSFCGLRAVGSTGDFIIRPSRPRYISLGGIESPGLSASVAIAPYVVELLRAEGLELVEDPDFDPIRAPRHAFREGSATYKNQIIRQDPTYGRIICRCEGISEGEILDAIRSNPPARDIDGVKRRTRAGMGRCQGGFCAPYVMELISRELGIPPEEVTRSGGESRVVIGKTQKGTGWTI